MPPSRRSQLNREIRQVEKQYKGLLAKRAELDANLPEKPPRFSQDDVAAYLAEHPQSTYTEVAEGLGAPAINIAQHLSRGHQSGRFTKTDDGAQKSGRFSNSDDGGK